MQTPGFSQVIASLDRITDEKSDDPIRDEITELLGRLHLVSLKQLKVGRLVIP